jgi:DNA-binding PadR family transcriptional regulator
LRAALDGAVKTRTRDHQVSLRLLYRLTQRGWQWLVDPRRGNKPMLRAPHGTLFDFHARPGAGLWLSPTSLRNLES